MTVFCCGPCFTFRVHVLMHLHGMDNIKYHGMRLRMVTLVHKRAKRERHTVSCVLYTAVRSTI